MQPLINEIEQPGRILNFVYLLGFSKKQYECEYYHPQYISEESLVLSTLENLGLISIHRDLHFEKGERTMMIRTVSLTEYGLILLKNCDKEMKQCLASAKARGAILESEA